MNGCFYVNGTVTRITAGRILGRSPKVNKENEKYENNNSNQGSHPNHLLGNF